MTFAIVDYIFAGIIIIFAIIGVIKGFIDNIFGKLCWILGLVAACLFYKTVSARFLPGIKNQTACDILGFLAVFVAVFLVIKIIQLIISKIFQFKILKSLDRTLGVFFGIVEGLAVVWLLIVILKTQPFVNVDNVFEGSFFYSLINNFMAGRNIPQISPPSAA